jgi:hypothetical protein
VSCKFMSYYTLIIRFSYCSSFSLKNNYHYRERKLLVVFYLSNSCLMQGAYEMHGTGEFHAQK